MVPGEGCGAWRSPRRGSRFTKKLIGGPVIECEPGRPLRYCSGQCFAAQFVVFALVVLSVLSPEPMLRPSGVCLASPRGCGRALGVLESHVTVP